MDSTLWDEKYAASDLVWSVGPNVFVERECADLPTGRILDVAGGEGRNSLWLATRGWDATLVDFSQVALDRATRLWAERASVIGSFATRRADVTTELLGIRDQDLVIVAYLQVEAERRHAAILAAAAAVAPDGRLLVVAHHSDNLTDGYAGPQDPALCYSEYEVADSLDGCGLAIVTEQKVARSVTTDDGVRRAWDCLVVAHRPVSG